MPLVQTRGAASAQGFGEFAQVTAANYIEDVFSCFLYTGNGGTQTITNNIDLSTKGGLVWIKDRTTAGQQHNLIDTVRGPTNRLSSNSTGASSNDGGAPSFNSNGFTVVANSSGYTNSGDNFVSWTFREQPKFFDIVTYTGNGVAGRTVAHNLGSVPGCMIIKPTSTSGEWRVWHRGLAAPATSFLYLNRTDAEVTGSTIWDSTNPTATEFTVSGSASNNGNGTQYVAYLFAHDAGGFGLTGTDNVISCGSATTNGSGLATVTLGYEPQWLLVRNVAGGNWLLTDNMRGWGTDTSGVDNLRYLAAESLAIEAAGAGRNISSTGFNFTTGSTPSSTYIYIAIRRGPMKVPETGTSVFKPTTYTGDGNASITISTVLSPLDLMIVAKQVAATPKFVFTDRLRGSGTAENADSMRTLTSTTTVAESDSSLNGYYATVDFQTSVKMQGSSSNTFNTASAGYILYAFQRAPSFFDEVCYAGNAVAGRSVPHNLAAVPELMIVKGRTIARGWFVYSAALGGTKYLTLNSTDAQAASNGPWNDTTQTSSSVFVLGGDFDVNYTGYTYVAYLFATCAGVSKVGSYTGTGTTQTINCGFTAGSRFVMIKRTDSTGAWYVWDSARGIIAGNDPYLLLNSTAAEVTGTDYVDTANSGFEISSTAPAAINANGGNYIFLAIA